MSEQLDLAREAVGHLRALANAARTLAVEPELAFATEVDLALLALRLSNGIEEVEAREAGKPSPRSLLAQAVADARAKEEAKRHERETKWAREHNWEVGVPPEGKR